VSTHPYPYLTRDDLFEFILRFLPDHVKAELDTGGEGFYRAVANVWERLSRRNLEIAESTFILAATGEARATATARIFRADDSYRVGFRAGQVIAQTRWGVRYRLVEDLDIGIGVALTPRFDIEAELSGFDANVRIQAIGRWGFPDGVDRKSQIAWLDGIADADKDTFLAAVDLGEDWRDLDVAVDGAWIEGNLISAEWVEGGALATLDLLAQERGLPRLQGETDVALRRRIRTLPDVLTPAAIERAVTAYLAGTGATFELLEPWEYGWVVGDDPRGAIGVYPVAGIPAFVIVVTGLPFDPIGWAVGDDPLGAIGTTPIGVGDPAHDAIIAGLQDLVRQIRAAGVCGRVVEAA
jgi:hypothetical protein